jgi:hypothetical protein
VAGSWGSLRGRRLGSFSGPGTSRSDTLFPTFPQQPRLRQPRHHPRVARRRRVEQRHLKTLHHPGNQIPVENGSTFQRRSRSSPCRRQLFRESTRIRSVSVSNLHVVDGNARANQIRPRIDNRTLEIPVIIRRSIDEDAHDNSFADACGCCRHSMPRQRSAARELHHRCRLVGENHIRAISFRALVEHGAMLEQLRIVSSQLLLGERRPIDGFELLDTQS